MLSERRQGRERGDRRRKCSSQEREKRESNSIGCGGCNDRRSSQGGKTERDGEGSLELSYKWASRWWWTWKTLIISPLPPVTFRWATAFLEHRKFLGPFSHCEPSHLGALMYASFLSEIYLFFTWLSLLAFVQTSLFWKSAPSHSQVQFNFRKTFLAPLTNLKI